MPTMKVACSANFLGALIPGEGSEAPPFPRKMLRPPPGLWSSDIFYLASDQWNGFVMISLENHNSVPVSWLNSSSGVYDNAGNFAFDFQPLQQPSREGNWGGGSVTLAPVVVQGGWGAGSCPDRAECRAPALSTHGACCQQMILVAVSLLQDLKSFLLGHFVSDKIEASIFNVIDILLVLEVTRNDGWVFDLFFSSITITAEIRGVKLA